jgi:hypothetical protein
MEDVMLSISGRRCSFSGGATHGRLPPFHFWSESDWSTGFLLPALQRRA